MAFDEFNLGYRLDIDEDEDSSDDGDDGDDDWDEY